MLRRNGLRGRLSEAMKLLFFHLLKRKESDSAKLLFTSRFV